MIHQVQIKSLPQEWLWCETWCSDESKATAKTIDMVSVSFFFTHRFLVDEERIVFLFCFIISGCEFPAIGFVTRFCLIIPARFKYIPSRYLLFQSYQRKRQNSVRNLLKVSNRNIERPHSRCSDVFLINFEHISYIVLLLPLLL